jgi:hypothetical protein
MDLLVSNDDLANTAASCLLTEAETYFRAQKMSVILGTMVPFAEEYRFFRRAGYRNVIQALAPRTYRFGFSIYDKSESSLVSLSARDWFVTQTDHEAH